MKNTRASQNGRDHTLWETEEKKTEKKNESKPKTQKTTERIKSGMKLTRACEMAKYRENGTHTHRLNNIKINKFDQIIPPI